MVGVVGALVGGLVSAGVWAAGVGRLVDAPETVTPVTVPAQLANVQPLGANAISRMVQEAQPAVVKIVATQSVSGSTVNPFFLQVPETMIQRDEGTGFFINAAGDIVTNDHVIHGSHHIEVFVQGYSHPFIAHRVGTDYAADLAVIQVKLPKPSPYLRLGSSHHTPVGAWVVAIGNPYGLKDTVTVGVISAKGRPLTIGNRHYAHLLQTSTAINPGNSGGPLLNLQGQVIGVNTAVAVRPAQGIGFAIPVSTVKQLLPKLMQHRVAVQAPAAQAVSLGWGLFGVTNQPAQAKSLGVPTVSGIRIVSVAAGSPASAAGLQPNDIIVAVNRAPVASVQAWQTLLARRTESTPWTLTIDHFGYRWHATLTGSAT
jgi:serine protease Do